MNHTIISTESINWKLSDNSPKTHKLLSLVGYSFLNPFHYSKAYLELGLLATNPTKIGDTILLTTNGIILRNKKENKIDVDKLFSYVNILFQHFRYESMQTRIKTANVVHAIYERASITTGRSQVQLVTHIGMRSYWLNTMLTWDSVKISDKKIHKAVELNVYEEILLDSFESLLEHQYKKCILFATIAIESLLAHTFDNLYESKLSKSNSNKKYRIIEKNGIGYIDPIYKSLKEKTDFKKLLHEIPLYLHGKSLLREKEKLYLNLRKLYATRNKIVHWGTALENDETKLIPVTENGANRAFEYALETFLWVGINRFEILRNRKFTTIN